MIGKGGNAEQVSWSSLTARLLPRLIKGRDRGPVFVSSLRPSPARQPAETDLCPVSGRARLSYRRAEEIFAQATTTDNGDHYTLHQIRHSRLTHLAEGGEDATMIKAKSRHGSLRSLERYVAPSNQAVKDMTNRHDPRGPGSGGLKWL